MRKLFAIFICAIMCLTLLASCEHRHSYGEFNGCDEGHWRPYTCGCPYTMVLDEHIDENENGICDKCAYPIPEHEHTYQKSYDEISHSWSYTCGCITPPNSAQHFDGNSDGECDDCEYVMGENAANSGTVMLTDILQRLQFEYNVEGLIDKYDFYDTQDYYLIDNPYDYCEFLSDIGVPYEGTFDFLFEESVMFCYLRCVSGSADFIPVEYYYDGDTNKIECKTVYQPEPGVEFPAVEICWCVDLVEVPKSIFEQLSKG